MAKKNAHSSSKNANSTESPQPKISGGEGRPGDMDHLREILFGNQARETEDRLNLLEDTLQALRGEFTEALNKQATAFREAAGGAEKELTNKLNNQANIAQTSHQALEESFSQLRADAKKQLEAVQTQFSQELEKMRSSLAEQIRRLQSESRQRDDDLRQELLTMSSWLDNKLTPRQDLGQMLIEIGQHLQNDANGQDNSSQDE